MFEMGANLDEEELELQGAKKSAKKKQQKQQEQSGGETLPKERHRLVFTFERRNGKPVTRVGRFYLADKEKKALLKKLKSTLGCGGAINGEWLELQGELKERIKGTLQKRGWKFK